MEIETFDAKMLYEFIRGAIGFSLFVAGISIIWAPAKKKITLQIGLFFCTTGFLFVFGTLTHLIKIPLELVNFLSLLAMLVTGKCFFEIALYLLGDERKRGTAKRMFITGVILFSIVWALSFFDYLLKLTPVMASPEDRVTLGPFHTIAAIVLYVWPIIILLIAPYSARFTIHDIPARVTGSRLFVRSSYIMLTILGLILTGIIVSSPLLYRIGHFILPLFILSWYFLYISHPYFFSRARTEIRATYEKNQLMGDDETHEIGSRMSTILSNPSVVCTPELDLRSLSSLIKVPPYRLSIYFNSKLKTTFPVWLNAIRIERIKTEIVRQPDRPILEIAMEIGYSSKSVFNAQFSRIVGMSPSEYRKSMLKK